MKIIRTYLPKAAIIDFSFYIWRIGFSLYLDHRVFRGTFLFWYFEHLRGYAIFPPKSDYFADNIFKGRLKRFYRDSRFKHEP